MGRGFLFCLTHRVGFHLSGGKWHTGIWVTIIKGHRGKAENRLWLWGTLSSSFESGFREQSHVQVSPVKMVRSCVAYMGMLPKATQTGLPGSGMRSGEQHSPGLSPSCS